MRFELDYDNMWRTRFEECRQTAKPDAAKIFDVMEGTVAQWCREITRERQEDQKPQEATAETRVEEIEDLKDGLANESLDNHWNLTWSWNVWSTRSLYRWARPRDTDAAVEAVDGKKSAVKYDGFWQSR